MVELADGPESDADWLDDVDFVDVSNWASDGTMVPADGQPTSLEESLKGIFPALLGRARESDALRAVYSWLKFLNDPNDSKSKVVAADDPKLSAGEREAQQEKFAIRGMLDNSIRDSLLGARGGRSSNTKFSILALLLQPAFILILVTGLGMLAIIFRS